MTTNCATTTKHVVSTAKKIIATGSVAFALAGLGLIAGVSTAAADTGTYDELLNLQLESCWHSGLSSGCAHLRDSSSYPLAASYPAASSYPGDSSWPGGNAKP